MRLITLIIFIFVQGITYCQIYCPAEENFCGPVKKVDSKIYSQEFKVLSGSNDEDTLKFSESSVIEIEQGKIAFKSIRYSTGNLKCICKKQYAENGDLIERTTFAHDSLIDTRIVYYWQNKEIIKTERYNRRNEPFSTTIYQIDSSSHTVKSMELINGETDNLIFVDLDNSFLPIKYYTVDQNGNKELFKIIEYDSSNRVKTGIDWNKDKSRYDHVSYRYDSLDRIIEGYRYNAEGEYIGKDSISYDLYSNVLYSRSYDSIRNLWTTQSFSYKYDEYGNYTSKVTWLVHGPYQTMIAREERTLTYE